MRRIMFAVRPFSRQTFSALHFLRLLLSDMLRSPQGWQFPRHG